MFNFNGFVRQLVSQVGDFISELSFEIFRVFLQFLDIGGVQNSEFFLEFLDFHVIVICDVLDFIFESQNFIFLQVFDVVEVELLILVLFNEKVDLLVLG